MDLVELSLILILAVALIGAAARRVPIPAPPAVHPGWCGVW
jgi:hypothetical protein